jgi:hypothetical protein
MTGTVDREVREDVTEVLVRYATGIDTRDWELFRSCFTDDELVATSDGWKIAKRRFSLVMVQLYPEGTKLEI